MLFWKIEGRDCLKDWDVDCFWKIFEGKKQKQDLGMNLRKGTLRILTLRDSSGA